MADAKALLDIANTLVTSVKSQTNEGITPSDFVNALLKKHGEENGGESTGNTIHWEYLGCNVAYIFRNASGCSTMYGSCKVFSILVDSIIFSSCFEVFVLNSMLSIS